jgi:hypothetical protein
MYIFDWNAKRLGSNLRNLGVQTLTHFNASVRNHGSSIGVQMHQCRADTNALATAHAHADLDGHHCNAALLVPIGLVELLGAGDSVLHVGLLLAVGPNRLEVLGLHELHSVLRQHAFAIQVDLLEHMRIEAGNTSQSLDDTLCDDNRLRRSSTAHSTP